MESYKVGFRVLAAIVCLMISVWSVFGMLVVPYYTAMEFPLIRKDMRIQYEQRMDPPETGVAWLFRRLY